MKDKKNLLLIMEALLCIGICIFSGSEFNFTNEILSFPFKQISLALRELSLLSSVGNVFSWMLFILICGAPVIICIMKLVKKSFALEDILLIVISLISPPALFYMINSESIISNMIINTNGEQLIWILGAIIYSVIVSYALIKIVRCFIKSEKTDLKRYLKNILFVVNIFLTMKIFGFSLEQLMVKLNSYNSTNTLLNEDMIVTYVLVIMSYVIDVTFCMMVIGIIILVQELVDKIDMENITDDVIKRAKLISKLCVIAMIIYALLTIGYNVLQLIFIKELFVLNVVVSFPFGIVIAMLVIMLLLQFVLEARHIKEENDMFI